MVRGYFGFWSCGYEGGFEIFDARCRAHFSVVEYSYCLVSFFSALEIPFCLNTSSYSLVLYFINVSINST